jgi:CheY-like chemotaxis protein
MMPAENSIRILTVDDHLLLREGIASVLASEEDMALVAEADNGGEAIEQFRIHHPDIILIDVQMPHMSGVESSARREMDPFIQPLSQSAKGPGRFGHTQLQQEANPSYNM